MADYTMIYNAVEIDLAVSGAYNHLVRNGGDLVYRTEDQDVSGVKNFYDRPTVSGVPILLSGEGGSSSGVFDTVTAVSGKFGKNPTFSSGNFQTIAGGENNSTYANFSTVVGGKNNICSGAYSFIGGGGGDFPNFGNIVNGNYSSCLGGFQNKVLSNYAVCAGGLINIVSGINSASLGGSLSNVLGNYSFSLGSLITINNDYAGCINDGSATIQSSGQKTLVINFNSGTYINHALILSGPAPSTSTSSCVKGQIAVDTGYLYVGTGTNQWGRVALSTF